MIKNSKTSQIGKESLSLHRKYRGKLVVDGKILVRNKKDLALVYTPGVGAVSSLIASDIRQVKNYTMKGNTVAVISDGSAVLGLGNIGPEAALPVMEGKCLLFKKFANIDAIPIVLSTQDTEEIIKVVKAISPGFGGINLEDISAPRCFEIETRLKKELDIPVMHDDQHGTAIVILAGLINALKVAKKRMPEIKIAISGAGAAGTALAKILVKEGAKNILVCDRNGIIYKGRPGNSSEKNILAEITNFKKIKGTLTDAMYRADVLIGVSAPGLVTAEMVRSMSGGAIVFALANPVPEIMPDIAKKNGAMITATGRSDFPNQLNNALAFPGVFRGALDNGVKAITDEMKVRAACAIAKLVSHPTVNNLIPDIFDKRLVKTIARTIK